MAIKIDAYIMCFSLMSRNKESDKAHFYALSHGIKKISEAKKVFFYVLKMTLFLYHQFLLHIEENFM